MPAVPRKRTPFANLRRGGLYLAPLFLIPVVVLALGGIGVLDLDPRFERKKVLICNLLLYWGLAALLLAMLFDIPGTLGWLRHRWGALLASVLSLGVAVVGAELVVRRVRPPEQPGFQMVHSERLHHHNPVNDRSRGYNESLIVTNEDGFRSPYTREAFLEFGTRVAVLGDSYVFGIGVQEDKLLTRVLERGLRKELGSDDVAVLNTGAISLSPLLERVLFHEVIRDYRPTHVLLVLDGNDVGDDHKYARQVVRESPLRFDVPEQSPARQPLALETLLSPALDRLAVPFDTWKRFRPSRPDRLDYYSFSIEIDGIVETDRWFILRHPLALTRSYFNETFGYVRDIAQESEALGATFVLFVSPRYFHWSDRECPDNWAGHRYDYDEPHEFAYFEYFEEVSSQVDFPIVSLLPAFQESDVFPLVFSHDPHWNDSGHRVAGEALLRELIRLDLMGS